MVTTTTTPASYRSPIRLGPAASVIRQRGTRPFAYLHRPPRSRQAHRHPLLHHRLLPGARSRRGCLPPRPAHTSAHDEQQARPRPAPSLAVEGAASGHSRRVSLTYDGPAAVVTNLVTITTPALGVVVTLLVTATTPPFAVVVITLLRRPLSSASVKEFAKWTLTFFLFGINAPRSTEGGAPKSYN